VDAAEALAITDWVWTRLRRVSWALGVGRWSCGWQTSWKSHGGTRGCADRKTLFLIIVGLPMLPDGFGGSSSLVTKSVVL